MVFKGPMAQAIDSIELFWRARSGVSSVDYALMLGLVAGGFVIAVIALGIAVSGEITEATDCVKDSNPCN